MIKTETEIERETLRIRFRTPENKQISLLGQFNYEFRDAVKRELHKSTTVKYVDIDFSPVRLIDSTGLGALISFFKITNSRGGGIRLLNTQGPVVQILELTKLKKLFEITEMQAA